MPNKAQRRILRKNADLDIRVGAPRFTRDKFKIYCDYLVLKHDTLPDKSPAYLKDSLYVSPVTTIEFEYRIGRRLVGAGITDLCSRSLSSVYMFYDPDCFSRSLGTFSAIQEISFCNEHSIPHYYLGFYVRECSSMNYKERFQPHEILDPRGNWIAKSPRKTNTLVESTLASRAQSGADYGED
jgi:arginyl-tRNA--protein-N-Asp/Glu arginylyltransferase